MGNAGQANYAVRQGRRRRPDQDAGQGVGPVQDQRQRGRVRLDRDPPDRRPRTPRTRWRSTARQVQLGIPEQMRSMAPMLIPHRPPGHARGSSRRRVLPLLAVVELRPRPGPEHHRRPVHGDDHMKLVKPSVGRPRRPPRRRRRRRDLPGHHRRPQHLHGHLPRAPGLARPPALPRQLRDRRSTCSRARSRSAGATSSSSRVTVEAGDMLYVPPRVTHTVENASDDRAGRVRRRARLADRGLGRGALGRLSVVSHH